MDERMKAFAALLGSGEHDKPKPISGEEAAKYRAAMVHIDNLQPGDKVRWKGKEFATQTSPEITDIVEVFRVGEPGSIGVKGDAGGPYSCNMNDFTVAYIDSEGDLLEYAFDSRRFERVE